MSSPWQSLDAGGRLGAGSLLRPRYGRGYTSASNNEREVMAEPTLKVLGICGSLRKSSYNMAALRTCGELLPPGMSMRITTIGDIPHFNQEIYDAGLPEPAKRFRAEVA